jgi:hypothetical protein
MIGMTGQNGILIVFPEVFLERYLGVAWIIHIDKEKIPNEMG